jgi:hypothetical protein
MEEAMVQCVFTVGILRSALQVWYLAIVSKCMFILPLVDSILKRGEDKRDVKNGMRVAVGLLPNLVTLSEYKLVVVLAPATLLQKLAAQRRGPSLSSMENIMDLMNRRRPA